MIRLRQSLGNFIRQIPTILQRLLVATKFTQKIWWTCLWLLQLTPDCFKEYVDLPSDTDFSSVPLNSMPIYWRSLWAWKENNGLKGHAESSNFGDSKTELLSPALMLRAGCFYLGLITFLPRGLITPASNLPPPVQLQMPSQLYRLPKTSRLSNISLIASTNLSLNMKPPWPLSHSAWLLGPFHPSLPE